jgi:glycosyltransferase involved in cell wall biosynthesis
MNIVLGTDLFFPGISGMITAVRYLAEDLRAAGHQVTLICPESRSARSWASEKGLALLAMPALTIPMRVQQRAGIVLPTSIGRLREVVRNAHVVHLHSPFLLGQTIGRLARKEGVPVIVTNHALPENLIASLRLPLWEGTQLLSQAVWRWIGIGIRLADLVTAPTEYAAQVLRTHFANVSVEVISNGVRQPGTPAPIKFSREQRTPLRALYVGRLQREKRVDELLHAVRACLDTDVTVELVIVGDGPDRGRLERIVRRLGIAEHVRFTGLVSDDFRDAFYAQSHCLWIASRAELQCYAALEAMAAGRPVVAARSSALSETVPDRVAGRLYEPGDIMQIASIMRELFSEPDLYEGLCQGALTIAAQHCSSDVSAAFEKIYSSVVHHPTGYCTSVAAAREGVDYPAVGGRPSVSECANG